MHVDYKISLTDHDFLIGAQHKLIPSGYAGCVIKEGNIIYGPTYIAIRSQKHDSSTGTAESYQQNFDLFVECEEFKSSVKERMVC